LSIVLKSSHTSSPSAYARATKSNVRPRRWGCNWPPAHAQLELLAVARQRPVLDDPVGDVDDADGAERARGQQLELERVGEKVRERRRQAVAAEAAHVGVAGEAVAVDRDDARAHLASGIVRRRGPAGRSQRGEHRQAPNSD
jgi:hypothetical protein